MEECIVRIMQRLDSEGGIVRGIAEGRVQAEVNREAYERERRIAEGETKKVGVNCFSEEEQEPDVEFHPYREQEAAKQVERLRRVRRRRDNGAVQAVLARVRAAAEAGRNVMPIVMEAVEAHATVGEVCGALKEVFGAYREPVRF